MGRLSEEDQPPGIGNIMAALSRRRPVFHSEADFQHALAWELHSAMPTAEVRLEYRASRLRRPVYVDVWVKRRNMILAIELKYKTRAFKCDVSGESFALKDQAAQDLARYDFIKDIRRLERIASSYGNAVQGWAILLTNDRTYWKESTRADTIDRRFRLHDGRILRGYLTWSKHAGEGSIDGRQEGIPLDRTYLLTWQDYSSTAGSEKSDPLNSGNSDPSRRRARRA